MLAFSPLRRFSAPSVDGKKNAKDEEDNGVDPLTHLMGQMRFSQVRCAEKAADDPAAAWGPGWFGFLGYDLGLRLEERLRPEARRKTDADFPLAEFTFYGETLVHDAMTGRWSAYCLDGDPSAQARQRARLEWLAASTDARTETSVIGDPWSVGELAACMDRATYAHNVGRALSYIHAGDIYQVCLALRLSATFSGDAGALAHAVLARCPAAYGAVLPLSRNRMLISTSPELFLRVRGRQIETRPIKGTRPCSPDTDADRRFHDELLSSDKERAELAMITDLLRNDLAKVSEYGTVTVEQGRVLETYPHVRHAYSVIRSVLREDMDAERVLRAAFPGGSVTGAPKLRAMQIIAELEPCPRGPYCGAIGRIGLDGDMDFSIAIRTVCVGDGHLSFHVGSGIVADSDPAAEYEEALHKAQALRLALDAGAGASRNGTGNMSGSVSGIAGERA